MVGQLHDGANMQENIVTTYLRAFLLAALATLAGNCAVETKNLRSGQNGTAGETEELNSTQGVSGNSTTPLALDCTKNIRAMEADEIQMAADISTNIKLSLAAGKEPDDPRIAAEKLMALNTEKEAIKKNCGKEQR
jgi:hypothetical protein